MSRVSVCIMISLGLLLHAGPVLAEKSLPPLDIELEELWRRGGEGDEVFFGLPVEALADPEGRVLVADQQLCQVFVFGPGGELERTLSREGEGPGEVRYAVDLVWLEDGDLGIVEFFPGKTVRLKPDGTPGPSLTTEVAEGQTGGFVMQTMAETWNGHFIVAGSRSVPKDKFTERIHFLAGLDADGVQTVRYMEQVSRIQRPHSVVHENDFLPSFPLASALGPDGRVYTPRDREHYAINVFRPDGTLETVIERPGFKTWKRNKKDTELITKLFESWAGANPETWPRFDLKKTDRAISTLHVDGQGRLWVQHSRSNRDLPEGVFLSLDRYEADGTGRREVRLHCEGGPVRDGLRFLRDGRVLLIKGFVEARLACLGSGVANFGTSENPELEIICYRLPDAALKP